MARKKGKSRKAKRATFIERLKGFGNLLVWAGTWLVYAFEYLFTGFITVPAKPKKHQTTKKGKKRR